MSSLWTPGGERTPRSERPADAQGEPPEDALDDAEREVAEELAALQAQLAETPAAVVVTNHCLGIWELAALHLSQQPPQLSEASIAIDALGAIVERLEGRLGDDEPTLRDALAQLRLAYVQIKASAAG